MKKEYILFLLIIILAAFFRFSGINWDQGMHLHPDERFLTMVTSDITWPTSITHYFDTNISPLNPHNKSFPFYVYGTWPVLLTKAVAQAFSMDSYDNVNIVGRTLSGFFDILTLLTVMAISIVLTKRKEAAIFSGFIYATLVLPIQLSHFYTVDSFATFCITLSLYLLISQKIGIRLALAIGLSIAAKISSIFILIPVAIYYALLFPWRGSSNTVWKHRLHQFIQLSALIMGIGIVIRIAYPYLFDGIVSLNPKVLANWKELTSFDGVETHFPPALQWIGTTPLFTLFHTIFFGMGIIHATLFIIALIWFIKALLHKKIPLNAQLLLWWILIIFIYQSTRFAKPLRYLFSIYPIIAVVTGIGIERLLDSIQKSRFKRYTRLFCVTISILLLLWPVMFMHIYTTPHTRVQASKWIYENISPDKTIAWEHWDDPLPLLLDGHNGDEYTTIQLPMYNEDSIDKWKKLSGDLSKTDYLILSSNRVYGGIGQASKRYPFTTNYYARLFNGSLGFTLLQEFISRPTLPFFFPICINPHPLVSYGFLSRNNARCETNTIQLIDDFAEESFTVYDHPKVLIFANTKHISSDKLYLLITQ